MKKLVVSCALIAFSGCTCRTVEPGTMGVKVSWGEVSPNAIPPGFVTAGPGTNIYDISTRQQKKELKANCFSSDLQQVDVQVVVLYRIPESNVVKIFTDYHGEPFDTLVAPRVLESVKEATSTRSAEKIVKEREMVKAEALKSIQVKVGNTLVVEDITIQDIELSNQLKQAIEEKMVQEQLAAKAKYTTEKAKAEAETAKAVAEGEAAAIKIKGDALRDNPAVLQLEALQMQRELITKWNGQSPQVSVAGGAGNGVNLLLPAVGALK